MFDQADPASVIARTTAPFLGPDIADERTGHVGNVCFAQALVLFQAEWRVYFGMADSRIGCATAPVS